MKWYLSLLLALLMLPTRGLAEDPAVDWVKVTGAAGWRPEQTTTW